VLAVVFPATATLQVVPPARVALLSLSVQPLVAATFAPWTCNVAREIGAIQAPANPSYRMDKLRRGDRVNQPLPRGPASLVCVTSRTVCVDCQRVTLNAQPQHSVDQVFAWPAVRTQASALLATLTTIVQATAEILPATQ